MRRLPTYWYPVDPAAKVIYDQPRRHRWQIYELAGIDVGGPWQRIRPAVLGWPERTFMAASILAALCLDKSMPDRMLRGSIEQLHRRLGWPPCTAGIGRASVRLLHEGAINRFGRRKRRYRLGGIEPRSLCALVPIRGRDLGAGYVAFDVVSAAPLACITPLQEAA